MNTQTLNTNTTRFFLVAAAAVGMLLFVSITLSFGQKEDFEAKRATSREGLMDTGFMTKADVSDDLDGTDDEYFYKFTAGPGKLTVTLEVDANETNAGAYLDLFGINSKPILQNMLVQAINGGSDRVSQSVKLAKKQVIVMRIKGIKYGSSGGYTGTYKIVLEGPAASFKDADPSDGAVEVKKPDVAPPDGTGQDKKPDEAPSDVTVEVKKPDGAPSDGTVEVKKPDEAPSDGTVEVKKPDAVDRVIEKGKAKSNKLIELLKKVKEKIPD